MKRLLKLTVLLLFAATIQIYAQNEGDPAPAFKVGLLGGGSFSLADHEGKVVAVFFFGNTCPSCRAVAPDIESSINQAFISDSANFIIVGIDTWDSSSNENSVSGFKNRTGITFPLGIKGGDVAVAYKSTYDRLLVIDKAGTLVHKGLVVASNDVNNAVAAIEEGLAVTGVNDFRSAEELQVYPNPARDILHIQTGGRMISGFTLFDLSGKKVKELELNTGQSSTEIEMNIQDLEAGVYLYSVQNDGLPSTGKLIIQK